MNCSATHVAAEITQLTVFLDYIEKSANRECPGGLAGCVIPGSNNTSCIDRVAYFLEKNDMANRADNQRAFRLHLLLTVFAFLIIR